MRNFPAISRDDDDDDVCLALHRHSWLDFYSTCISSLKQQSVGRNAYLLGHIILILSQPSLCSYSYTCCMLSQEVTNTNFIPMQSVPITTYVVSSYPAQASCTWACTTLCDKVYQWLATSKWFSLVFTTNKTDRHNITEILLKVASSTIKPTNQFYSLRSTAQIKLKLGRTVLDT